MYNIYHLICNLLHQNSSYITGEPILHLLDLKKDKYSVHTTQEKFLSWPIFQSFIHRGHNIFTNIIHFLWSAKYIICWMHRDDGMFNKQCGNIFSSIEVVHCLLPEHPFKFVICCRPWQITLMKLIILYNHIYFSLFNIFGEGGFTFNLPIITSVRLSS